MRVLGAIARNVVLVLTLLLFTNLLCAVALAHASTFRPVARFLGMDTLPPTSSYVALPMYRDKQEARTIWREFDESHVVRFQPFVEWRRRPYAGETIHVNDEGVRYWPSEPSRPPGAPVVRLFGGSSMWGTGVTDSETIPAALGKLRPRLRVINQGESEYNTRQGLEQLESLLSLGRPVDVAVFYEGFNDVLTLCRDGVSLTGQGEERRMRTVLDRAGTVGDVLFGRTLEALARVFGPSPESFTCADDPARAKAVARTVLNSWAIAHDLLATRGVPSFVVLQPVAAVGSPTLDYFADLHTPGRPSQTSTLAKQLQAVYPYWQRAAHDGEYPWLRDFSHLLDGAPPTYVDHVHLSAAGNARVAARLAPLVDEALSTKVRDQRRSARKA